MFFDIIASGSKGNATIVKFKSSLILIDMGITCIRLSEELKRFNLSIDDIDAAIFTHDHSDHIKGLKFLKPKICYALENTLPSSLSNVVKVNEPFYINEIKITPFMTYHDAKNPCGYMLEGDDEKLVYMTDTGKFNETDIQLVKNPDYIIIESNHDIPMLLKTKRTAELKNRILSELGHLCNEDSAAISAKMIGNKTKQIFLAHLSEEANTPSLALSAYKKIFTYFGLDFDKYKITCAKQNESIIGGDYDQN